MRKGMSERVEARGRGRRSTPSVSTRRRRTGWPRRETCESASAGLATCAAPPARSTRPCMKASNSWRDTCSCAGVHRRWPCSSTHFARATSRATRSCLLFFCIPRCPLVSPPTRVSCLVSLVSCLFRLMHLPLLGPFARGLYAHACSSAVTVEAVTVEAHAHSLILAFTRCIERCTSTGLTYR